MVEEEKKYTLEDVLKILSSPTNLKIILLLSQNEMSVGELARYLEKDETNISKRVAQMRKAGMVAYKWRRVAGKNVKFYRLTGNPLRITIDRGSIKVEGTDNSELQLYSGIDVLWKKPRARVFVGRKKELKELNKVGKGSLLIVTGVPGIGKTTLVSKYIESFPANKVMWHTVTSSDYLEGILKKISLFLSINNRTALQRIMGSPWYDTQSAANLAIEELDRIGAVLVFDDYHKLRDARVTEMIVSMAKREGKTMIILVSRVMPKIPKNLPNVKTIVLAGLDPSSSLLLVKNFLKEKLDRKEVAELVSSIRGHPLLLRWFVEVANTFGVKKAFSLLRQGDVARRFWNEIFTELSDIERKILLTASCLGGKISPDYIYEDGDSDYVRKAVHDLIDRGLLYQGESHLLVNDLVYSIIKRAKNMECKGVMDKYIQYLLTKPSTPKFLEAMEIALEVGENETVRKLVVYRNTTIRSEILDYILPYNDILEKALKKNLDIEAKHLLLIEKANLLNIMGEIKKAAEIYMSVVPAIDEKKYPEIKSLALSRMIFLDEKNGLEHARESLRIASNIGDEKTKNLVLSYVYANIARYYAQKENWLMAKKYGDLELEYAKKLGDPIEYAFSYFHKIVYDGFVKGFPSSSELREIREIMEYYGSRIILGYVVLYESMSYLVEGKIGKAVRITKKYIRENLRHRNIPPPCELYGVLRIASILKNKRLEPKNLSKVCTKKENITCFTLLMEAIEKGLKPGMIRTVKNICGVLDFLYLEKIFERDPSKKNMLEIIGKKAGIL